MFNSTLARPLLALAALTTSATLFVGTATPAFAGSSVYRMVAVSPVEASRIIVKDTLWSCDGSDCVTSNVTSRPIIACASAAKKIGKISSFTVNGTALSSDELAKCNAKVSK